MILDLFLLEGSSYSSASVIYVYLLKTDGICKIYLRLTSTLNFATDCSLSLRSETVSTKGGGGRMCHFLKPKVKHA